MARNAVYSDFVVRAKDQFTAPMRKMQKQTSLFSRNTQRSLGRVSDSFRRLRGIIGAAGAAIAGRALVRGVGQFVEVGAEVERTARQLGIGTEALQKLQFTGEQFGVQSEALRDGLKELSLRADEFAVTGAGPASEAMERLGLTQAEVAAKSDDTAALFDTVRRRLSEVENVAARQRLADEIFGGTGGEQLVEVASLTTEEMRRFEEQAQRSGAVVSGETTAAMEKFSRSASRTKTMLRGVVANGLGPLLAQLQPVIEATGKWIQQHKNEIRDTIAQTFDRIKQAVQLLAKAWNSGLIPAIIAGVATFKILNAGVRAGQAIMVAYAAAQQAAAAAGGVLNAVMYANPVGLVIAAIAALIGIIVLLVKNWDKVTAALQRAWTWFSNLLDNPLIAAAATVFAPFLTIPAMIAKHWGPIKSFFIGLWKGIAQAFEDAWGRIRAIWDKVTGAARAVSRFFGGGGEQPAAAGAAGGGGAPMYGGRTVGQSTITENRSTVDINVGGLPQGSSVRQKGQAPGVSLNAGYGMAGL